MLADVNPQVYITKPFITNTPGHVKINAAGWSVIQQLHFPPLHIRDPHCWGIQLTSRRVCVWMSNLTYSRSHLFDMREELNKCNLLITFVYTNSRETNTWARNIKVCSERDVRGFQGGLMSEFRPTCSRIFLSAAWMRWSISSSISLSCMDAWSCALRQQWQHNTHAIPTANSSHKYNTNHLALINTSSAGSP